MTTNLEKLQQDVLLELVTVKYDWQDTDNNIRIVEEMRRSIDGFQEEKIDLPSARHIAEVAVACKEHIQMRDFLMGVRKEKPAPQIAAYLTMLVDALDQDYAVPFATVLSSYLYEFDMKQEAVDTISLVFKTDPDYSLAQLLSRVYEAGWDPAEMGAMANQLHDEVVKIIYRKETE